jgi:hypothetical protein
MMRSSGLRNAIRTMGLWWLATVRAAGQTPAPAPVPDPAEVRNMLSQSAFLNWTAIQGAPGGDADQFVTGATTVRGFALSLGGTSTFSKYTFPLKLTLSPFALTNTNVAATGIQRSLRDSNLEMQYKVLTYEQSKPSSRTDPSFAPSKRRRRRRSPWDTKSASWAGNRSTISTGSSPT